MKGKEPCQLQIKHLNEIHFFHNFKSKAVLHLHIVRITSHSYTYKYIYLFREFYFIEIEAYNAEDSTWAEMFV